MKRREFLKITGASSATLAVMPGMVSCMTSAKGLDEFGVQVYTVRDAIQKDFAGSLERIANIGYDYIELFGYNNGQYFGKSIGETKKLLSDLGLKVRSSHISLDTITNNWEQTINDAAELGHKYLVCPYLMDNQRQSIDDYKRHADTFNEKGESAKEYGIQFAYHNHDFEFINMNGQVPFDLLLESCDEDLVKFEMDIYWMYKAKQDPLAYFEKHPGRFPMWHVKDMTGDDEQFFAPVGKGVIDWKKLFNNAEQAGLDYFFVEQDATRNGKPFENIETSINYLRSL